MTSIFLSYARDEDEAFVRSLYQDLTAAGLNVWFDRVSMPSRALTFLQEIRDAITDHDRLLFVIGPKAVTSDYVSAEWRWALEIGKAITPILRLGEYSLLPNELMLLDTPDFRDNDAYDFQLQKLVRQLSEPVVPMGKLVGVPSLPPHFLPRPERIRALKEAVLADLQRPVVVTGVAARTGIHGMGGIGKSVLATAFARDHEVRRAFTDGVVWIPFGQEPSLEALQKVVAQLFNDPGDFDSVHQGKGRLGALLADRAVLLVLDDVWDAEHTEAFDVLGPRCRTVITTRDAAFLTALGSIEHQVQLLTDAEALALLAAWAECLVTALPPEANDVMSECGRLPLALSICGAMVRDRTPWNDLAAALRNADLEFLDHPHGNIFKSIKVSVDTLASEEACRFAELSVFPLGTTTPMAAVEVLWAFTGAMTARNARRLLAVLERRSLVRTDNALLHDLVHDFATRMAGERKALHDRLLDAYREQCSEDWSSGPNDGYFFQHLPHHLVQSGREEELRSLLLNYDFLQAKLDSLGPQPLIEDYALALGHLRSENTNEEAGEEETLRLLQGAIRLSANVLATDSNQLLGQLLGRLLCIDLPAMRVVLKGGRHRTNPWICPMTQCLTSPNGPLIRSLEGHTNTVSAVRLVPGMKLAVSASRDASVRVWDLEKGQEVWRLVGHSSWVLSLGVTPDAKRVISSSLDHSLKIWDLEHGQELCTLSGHVKEVDALCITNEGNRVVSVSGDGTAVVWNVETGDRVFRFTGHSDYVCSVNVTANDRHIVSGSWDGTAKVWDLEIGALSSSLEGNGSPIHRVALIGNDFAIIGRKDASVSVWDLTNAKSIVTFDKHKDQDDILVNVFTSLGPMKLRKKFLQGGISALAVSSDGKIVLSASGDRRVKGWYTANGHEIFSNKYENWINCLLITPDNDRFLATDGSVVHYSDMRTGEQISALVGHTAEVTDLALTPGGEKVVSASDDSTIKVWDLSAAERQRHSSYKLAWIRQLELSADGLQAFCSRVGEPILTFDFLTGKRRFDLGPKSENTRVFYIVEDATRLLAVSRHDTLISWELGSRDLEFEVPLPRRDINALVLSPDKQYVVLYNSSTLTYANDQRAVLYSLKEKKKILNLEGHAEGICSMGVTPNGAKVITGGHDGLVKIWDLKTGELHHVLQAGKRHARIAISEDGKTLASASEYQTLRLWEIETGKLLHSFTGHTNDPKKVLITPGGRWVLSSDWHGVEAKVWDTNSGREVLTRQDHSLERVFAVSDRTYVVSVFRERAIQVWEVQTGKPVCTFTGESHLGHVSVSRDGQRIVASDQLQRLHFLRVCL